MIVYKGKVKVEIEQDGKKTVKRVYNSGTTFLFNTLCKFLCGDTTAFDSIPQYVDLGKIGEDGSFTSILRKQAPINNRYVESENNNYKAVFTASILATELEADLTNATAIALYDSNGNQLAYVSTKDLTTAFTNYSIFVTWEQYFENKE